jgi:hypothetical protein
MNTVGCRDGPRRGSEGRNVAREEQGEHHDVWQRPAKHESRGSQSKGEIPRQAIQKTTTV